MSSSSKLGEKPDGEKRREDPKRSEIYIYGELGKGSPIRGGGRRFFVEQKEEWTRFGI